MLSVFPGCLKSFWIYFILRLGLPNKNLLFLLLFTPGKGMVAAVSYVQSTSWCIPAWLAQPEHIFCACKYARCNFVSSNILKLFPQFSFLLSTCSCASYHFSTDAPSSFWDEHPVKCPRDAQQSFPDKNTYRKSTARCWKCETLSPILKSITNLWLPFLDMQRSMHNLTALAYQALGSLLLL